MHHLSTRRPLALFVGLTAGSLALGACSASGIVSGGSSASGSGAVTLNFLVDNAPTSVNPAQALAKAFHAANPTITVTVSTRPAGTDGDNLIKTRLATGNMADVFLYNSGSLFQAIAPEKNLVPQNGQPFVSNLAESFTPTVSVNKTVYGAPFGTAFAGGIMYNIPVYKRLGLSVPTTWAQFMSNNAKIKAAGIDPVIQTYKDTWTSQLLVLGDFHNVSAADPSWAANYTANKVKYSQAPALEGFQRLQAIHQAGYMNKDYASATYVQGLHYLATGKGAQYPMLSNAIGGIQSADPSKVKDIGFFAQPSDNASTNGATVWLPAGVYIPKTTTGAKLTAAEKFLNFISSKPGCDAQTTAAEPTGPYPVKGCTLPTTLPPLVKDLQAYFNATGKATPALEFLSPVKGPNLEQITVEVGSGIVNATKGASLYDQDVKKEAQQLNLPGWS